MKSGFRLALATLVAAVLVPAAAFALMPGSGKIESIVPNAAPVLNSHAGCFAGPITVGSIDNWYLEQGHTYSITLSDVFDCANNGTDATIIVEIRSASSGSVFMLANWVAPGKYAFQFTMPSNACGPFQVIYCVGCVLSTDGMTANGSGREADLFPAQFFNNCSFYSPVYCSTPAPKSTWGTVKSLYR